MNTPRFSLGPEILIHGLEDTSQAPELMTLLQRHQGGDWGAVTLQISRRNEQSLARGLAHWPLVSHFPLVPHAPVVITTNRARGQTTVEFST